MTEYRVELSYTQHQEAGSPITVVVHDVFKVRFKSNTHLVYSYGPAPERSKTYHKLCDISDIRLTIHER